MENCRGSDRIANALHLALVSGARLGVTREHTVIGTKRISAMSALPMCCRDNMSATETKAKHSQWTTHHCLHTRHRRGTLQSLGWGRCPRLVCSIWCESVYTIGLGIAQSNTDMHTLGLDDLTSSSSSPSSLPCHWFSSSESAFVESSLSLDLASEDSFAASSAS